MSHVKRDWERGEAIRDAVTAIAADLGALASCSQCGAVSDVDDEMREEVRAEALKQFHAGGEDLREAEGDQEVVDAVDSVMADTGDECSCQPSLAGDPRDEEP
ncbi:hypothetical protein [Myxococcus sp. AS-1-15]|uniref:hypothetical protein n=1 Tax=Myxococcus sp. AS-1-15 TaxID=2874600 RepID=UPI001CBBD6D6|nr:hypothetical protein [Myxococcus sp. AS-1-15]MBZ4402024.1 hypothetical protein [Myxococcus sp. AS-1-15]